MRVPSFLLIGIFLAANFGAGSAVGVVPSSVCVAITDPAFGPYGGGVDYENNVESLLGDSPISAVGTSAGWTCRQYDPIQWWQFTTTIRPQTPFPGGSEVDSYGCGDGYMVPRSGFGNPIIALAKHAIYDSMIQELICVWSPATLSGVVGWPDYDVRTSMYLDYDWEATETTSYPFEMRQDLRSNAAFSITYFARVCYSLAPDTSCL